MGCFGRLIGQNDSVADLIVELKDGDISIQDLALGDYYCFESLDFGDSTEDDEDLDVEYFDAVVLSDDIGVNKPDKRIFDHALKKSNALADCTLIIGDNPDTDIAGAVNAGWHAIYFNRNGEGKPISMDNAIEIFKLSEIQHIL